MSSIQLGKYKIQWVKNWLTGQAQRVTINEVTPVTSGHPQGSISGTVVFKVFINDLNVGLMFILCKFAVDTKLGAVGSLKGREACRKMWTN